MNDKTPALTRDGNPRQRHRWEVSSGWIAQKTGYDRTGIYRMRTDSRPPTLDRMERLQESLGWSKLDQMVAKDNGRWTEEFERVVLDLYRKEKGTKS